MEKCDKSIIKLIEKCDNCKLNECINCEISYIEIQEIKKLLNRVTELKQDIEKQKTYYEFARELIEKYHNLINNIFKICSDNYIPKGKIREKIEEYEWAIESYDCSIADYKQSQAVGSWNVLRKLLEDK